MAQHEFSNCYVVYSSGSQPFWHHRPLSLRTNVLWTRAVEKCFFFSFRSLRPDRKWSPGIWEESQIWFKFTSTENLWSWVEPYIHISSAINNSLLEFKLGRSPDSTKGNTMRVWSCSGHFSVSTGVGTQTEKKRSLKASSFQGSFPGVVSLHKSLQLFGLRALNVKEMAIWIYDAKSANTL